MLTHVLARDRGGAPQIRGIACTTPLTMVRSMSINLLPRAFGSASIPAELSPISFRSISCPAPRRSPKSRARRPIPAIGLVRGVNAILARQRCYRPTIVAGLAHGTTVATNALLQGEINSLGLIVNAGFRHILEIARQSVPEGYGNSYFWVKPDRIVPLQFVREVGGRLDFRGARIAPARRSQRARGRADSSARRASAPSASACCIPTPTMPMSAAPPRSSREEYPDATLSLSCDGAAGIPRI